MSINISTSVLRNCVSNSLRVDVDFSRFQGQKRKNLISALRGEKKMADPTIVAIRRMFGLPHIGRNYWTGIAKDSGFWERAEEAIAIAQLKGSDAEQLKYSWYGVTFESQVDGAKKIVAARPAEAYINCYYFDWLDTTPTQTWVEPVSPDNGVWQLIAQLERGENPPITITFGSAAEYEPLPKKVRVK